MVKVNFISKDNAQKLMDKLKKFNDVCMPHANLHTSLN